MQLINTEENQPELQAVKELPEEEDYGCLSGRRHCKIPLKQKTIPKIANRISNPRKSTNKKKYEKYLTKNVQPKCIDVNYTKEEKKVTRNTIKTSLPSTCKTNFRSRQYISAGYKSYPVTAEDRAQCKDEYSKVLSSIKAIQDKQHMDQTLHQIVDGYENIEVKIEIQNSFHRNSDCLLQRRSRISQSLIIQNVSDVPAIDSEEDEEPLYKTINLNNNNNKQVNILN